MTVFLELHQVHDSGIVCFGCQQILPRKGHPTPGPGYISFWFFRCPHCRQPHIVWNSTNVLPPVPEPPAEPENRNELFPPHP